MERIAIVTGAAGNMGQAVVKKFLSEGYRVIGTLHPTERFELEPKNALFENISIDLLDEAAANDFIQNITEKYNHIDVAVLTVGGFAMGNIEKTKSGDILKQYRLNFETAYNVARPVFLQMMARREGRIFLVGSRPGLSSGSGKGMLAYSLAKSLIFRLAEHMNLEAGSTNVVTSVLVPSTIDTPQNRKQMPDADFDSWVKPEKIAEAIYFYSTPQAAVIRQPVIKLYNNS